MNLSVGDVCPVAGDIFLRAPLPHSLSLAEFVLLTLSLRPPTKFLFLVWAMPLVQELILGAIMIDRPWAFVPFFSFDHLLPLPMPEVAGNSPAISAHRCFIWPIWCYWKMLNNCQHLKWWNLYKTPIFSFLLNNWTVGWTGYTCSHGISKPEFSSSCIIQQGSAVLHSPPLPPAPNLFHWLCSLLAGRLQIFECKTCDFYSHSIISHKPFQNYSGGPQCFWRIFKDKSNLLKVYLKIKTTLPLTI